LSSSDEAGGWGSEELLLPYLVEPHPRSEELGRCPGWNRARGAPKSAGCPMPGTERTKLINKRRLPCPGRPGVPALSGGGTGVRGRGVDAMMLRSAEADPHVIEHTTRMGAEAPFLVA
jgi:hypothetical protein